MWLKILMLIIQYGPTIWQIIKEILDLIEKNAQYLPESDGHMFRANKKYAMNQAATYYKVTKDKVKLHELHGELTCQLANFTRS